MKTIHFCVCMGPRAVPELLSYNFKKGKVCARVGLRTPALSRILRGPVGFGGAFLEIYEASGDRQTTTNNPHLSDSDRGEFWLSFVVA